MTNNKQTEKLIEEMTDEYYDFFKMGVDRRIIIKRIIEKALISQKNEIIEEIDKLVKQNTIKEIQDFASHIKGEIRTTEYGYDYDEDSIINTIDNLTKSQIDKIQKEKE